MEIKKFIVHNSISRVCFLGSIFLINILFARLLNASGSGELYYTINNFSIITLIVSFSLESAMTFFLAKKEIGDSGLISLIIVWSLAAAGLAVLYLRLFPSGYFSATKFDTPLYTFLFVGGSLLTTYFSGLFYARRQFFIPNIIPAITNTLVAICIAWVLYNTTIKKDEFFIVTMYFISFIINGILLGILYCSRYLSTFLLKWPQKKEIIRLIRYSGLAFITNIIAFLAYRVDYWMLKGFSPGVISDNALGNYIQVSKLVQLFLFAPTIVATVVFPTSASGTDLFFNKRLKKIVWKSVLLNIGACAIVLLAGKWLFIFLYGDSFSGMYTCFVLSIPAILAITVVRIVTSYFAGSNQIKFNLAGSSIALVIIVCLNILLIPLMGINGSAVADSTGYLAYMIFLLIIFNAKGRENL